MSFNSRMMMWFIMSLFLLACNETSPIPTGPTVTKLFIKPDDSTMVFTGREYKYHCLAEFDNMDTVCVDSAIWSSYGDFNLDLEVVDSGCVVVGSSEGRGYIRASYEGHSDSLGIAVFIATDSVFIGPESFLILAGDSQVFHAIGWIPTGENLSLRLAQWELFGGGIASISCTEGDSTILVSEAVGTATLEMVYGTTIESRFIPILTPGPFIIYADSGINAGFIGTFHGNNDAIDISFDTVEVYQGIHSIRADYDLSSKGWVGWYVEEGGAGSYETRDMAHFKDSGRLEFHVKTRVDLQIGIRSNNILAGDEKSKVFLSDYNIPADSSWQSGSIPLSDFQVIEPRTDFSQTVVFFVVALEGKHIPADQDHLLKGSFWIDEVRWVFD